ncbi:MAG TPA: hypothetical protein VF135_14410 [Terriglobales bacterium]
MAENVMDQIVASLRQDGAKHYPQRGELRNVRVVGHTPKTDHYIYDIVIDFADGSERVAAKVYRSAKCGPAGAKGMAENEFGNLERVYEIFSRKKLNGVPRPVGNFTELGAVVAEKLPGVPLQSIIMKAALLPGFSDLTALQEAARATGEWLRKFHKATADMPAPFDGVTLLGDLEKLCANCKVSGLDDASVNTIMSGTKSILSKTRRALPTSAVLNDFSPLSVVVSEAGVGFADFAKMTTTGNSFQDVALFLASVEALEKYPFCNRVITSELQQQFLDAYGLSASDEQVVRVLKMKALLSMFAQGRTVKESAMRKKVMWATVMKRFIAQAAERSLSPAA